MFMEGAGGSISAETLSEFGAKKLGMDPITLRMPEESRLNLEINKTTPSQEAAV